MNALRQTPLLVSLAWSIVVTPAIAADVYQLSSLPDFGQVPIRHLALDPVSQRLFAVQADSMSLLDTRHRTRIDSLSFTGEITGIALAPRDRRGFVSMGPRGLVQIFDLDSGEVLDSIDLAGASPGVIVHDEKSGRQFVADAATGLLLALDSADAVLDRIALAAAAGPMVTDGRGRLFGVIAGTAGLFIVDTETLEHQGEFRIPSCGVATGIDIDPVERRLFVPCDNGRLFALDSDTGLVLSRLPIGAGVSAVALDFQPDRVVNIFVASADGSITVARVAKVTFSVLQTLAGAAPGSRLVIDDDSGQAYLAGESALSVLLPVAGEPR